MVTLTLSVMGVDGTPDGGVVIFVVQEKLQIPVAEDLNSDEARFVKKMKVSMKAMGFTVDPAELMGCPPNNPRNFRTGFWMSMEDYEKLGKPTVGDVLAFNITVEKEK